MKIEIARHKYMDEDVPNGNYIHLVEYNSLEEKLVDLVVGRDEVGWC